MVIGDEAGRGGVVLEEEGGDEVRVGAEEEVDVASLVEELLELVDLRLGGRREEQLRQFEVLSCARRAPTEPPSESISHTCRVPCGAFKKRALVVVVVVAVPG